MITKIKANSRKSVANSLLVDAEKSTDEKSFTGMLFFYLFEDYKPYNNDDYHLRKIC
jgi:hypothetical protein